jgi:hypothetical protein
MARGTGLGSSIGSVKLPERNILETKEKMEKDKRHEAEKKLREYERELLLIIKEQEEERPSH